MMQFNTIKDKIEAGLRINNAEALYLYQEADLFDLGKLADWKNKQINGDKVYFNINRHINPTNVCVFASTCTFCSYADSVRDPHAYTMSLEEILKEAEGMEAEGAKEIHVVGGLHPHKDFDWYLEIVRQLRKAHPDVHLKTWTAVEIDYFTRITKKSIQEILELLVAAGMNSMPGGGAEIFAEDKRQIIASKKCSSSRWIEIHRLAHQMGIKSNCTMLYGHIESLEDRVDHLRRLRELQDETKGFNCFIPLAYHPENNALDIDHFTAGLDDLRNYAVARLYLDNFKHIKSYWIMVSEKLAQIALSFGVNDIDGTVTQEKIYHAAGAKTPQKLSVNELIHLIRSAGKIPVERDTVYNEIRQWDLAEINE